MDGESRRFLLGGFMKKIAKSVLVIALALTGALTGALSQAHQGAYGHGGYGYGHGHGGGWSRGSWVAPALAAGLI